MNHIYNYKTLTIHNRSDGGTPAVSSIVVSYSRRQFRLNLEKPWNNDFILKSILNAYTADNLRASIKDEKILFAQNQFQKNSSHKIFINNKNLASFEWGLN